MRLHRACFLALFWVERATGSTESDSPAPTPSGNFSDCVFVVDIRDVAKERKMAASIAIGLLNRVAKKPVAVALNAPNDWKWVVGIRSESELSQKRWVAASDADIVAFAVATGAAKAIIGYDPAEPWALPTVVTLAGIKYAIPIPNLAENAAHLSKDSRHTPFVPQILAINGRPLRSGDISEWRDLNLTLGLNAFGSEGDMSDPFAGARFAPVADSVSRRWVNALDATLWSWSHLHSECHDADIVVATQSPELLSLGMLADHIVAQQMFVFYLPDMCSPGAEQVMFRTIVAGAHDAGKQLKVMGYFAPTEVVADCSLHHTEISLVSDWCPNLSFYSRMQPIAGRMQQVAVEKAPVYNPNHTYLAVVNSDGDNMQMENNGNRDGMEERVQLCSQEGAVCPPLAWTISNQLAVYAPWMLQWYFGKGLITGRDTFLMGPSGFGFLHPAAVAPDSPILTQFIVATVEAAEKLSMTGYVHWDIDANGLTTRRSAAHLSTLKPRPSSLQPGSGNLHGVDFVKAGLVMEQSRQQGLRGATSEEANSMAREVYIRRYSGSPIDTVLAPAEYHLPEWLDGVAGITERIRWGIETPTEEAVNQANALERGTIAYMYKIWNVAAKEYERFGREVADHVRLVDYRQLRDIALQKKFAHSPPPGSI